MGCSPAKQEKPVEQLKTVNNNNEGEDGKLNINDKNDSIETIDIGNSKKISIHEPRDYNPQVCSDEKNTCLSTTEVRPRSISIRTDDGYDDLEETSEQADADVAKLHEAMGKFNTSEKDLVMIIVPRHSTYKQMLRAKYQEQYREDLSKAVKRHTSGSLQHLLTSLLLRTEEFLAGLLRDYVEDREYVLITETLTALNPMVVHNAKESYFQLYESTFAGDVAKSLDDLVPRSLKDVMIPLSTLQRNGNNKELEDEQIILSEADNLSQGPDEISDLLVRKPYNRPTLAAIFKQYKLKYYLDIKDSIDIEFHDDTQACLTAIVNISENCSKYFAGKLLKAFEDESKRKITNILVGRNEIELPMICEDYKELSNGKTLMESVKKEFSGSFAKAIEILLKKHTV